MRFKTFGAAIQHGKDLMEIDDRIADIHATTVDGKADSWILQLLPKPVDLSDLQGEAQIFTRMGFCKPLTKVPGAGLPPRGKPRSNAVPAREAAPGSIRKPWEAQEPVATPKGPSTDDGSKPYPWS